jgi:hypothetical protein
MKFDMKSSEIHVDTNVNMIEQQDYENGERNQYDHDNIAQNDNVYDKQADHTHPVK